MAGERRHAVDEFLEYYVRGPTYQMRLPELLKRAVQLQLEGDPRAALATLPRHAPQDRSEEFLVEFLHGLALTETRELSASAVHLVRALSMADEQEDEVAASLAMTAAATNSLLEGKQDESLRLLNDAAAIAPPGSDQSMAALYVLGMILVRSHAPAAGEAVLLELLSTRSWPQHAQTKIIRRLARIRIELDKYAEVGTMIETLAAASVVDRDHAEHAILVAFHAVASGQLDVARAELSNVRDMIDRMGIGHLINECEQLQVALIAEEAREQTTPERVAALAAVAENTEINVLTPRVQNRVIDALTHVGHYETAWRLSNEVVRAHLEEDVNLRGVFDITMRLSDSQAETRFASELGQKHERLDMLGERAGAVLIALSHGIRDPLTVLQLWFDGQQSGSLPDAAERRVVDAAIERMERLLDLVVWLARTDRYVPDALDRSVDLGRLADDSIAAHARWADFHDITIVALSSPSVDGADPSDGVSALVSALLSHATAYCTRGDSIELRLHLGSDGLTISITDDGQPLAETVEQAQSNNLARPRGEGGDATGDVALVVAAALAAKFGATINISRLADNRTTCSTTLPLRTSMPQDQVDRWTR